MRGDAPSIALEPGILIRAFAHRKFSKKLKRRRSAAQNFMGRGCTVKEGVHSFQKEPNCSSYSEISSIDTSTADFDGGFAN